MTEYALTDADGTVRWRGTISPSPGSQPGTRVVYGPFAVGFADFSGGDGSTVDIVTFPAGTLLTDWWADPDDSAEWVSDNNSGDGFMGQGAGWTIGTSGQLGEPFATGRGPNFVFADALNYFGQANGGVVIFPNGDTMDAGNNGIFPFPLSSGTPIQGKWQGGGDPAPTAGRTVLYFEVIVPPIPTTP